MHAAGYPPPPPKSIASGGVARGFLLTGRYLWAGVGPRGRAVVGRDEVGSMKETWSWRAEDLVGDMVVGDGVKTSDHQGKSSVYHIANPGL